MPTLAVQLLVTSLGGDSGDVEYRMGVVEPGQDPVLGDGVVPVECDQDLLGGMNALEAAQPIGQGCDLGLIGQAVVVPAGPGPAVGRQEPLVGVECGPVGLVPDGSEHLAFWG